MSLAYPRRMTERALQADGAIYEQEKRRGSLHAIDTGSNEDITPTDPSRITANQINDLLRSWFSDRAVLIAADIFQGAFSQVPFQQEKLKKGAGGEIPREPLDDEWSYPMMALRTNELAMPYGELLSTIAFWWQFTRRAYVAVEPVVGADGRTKYGFFPMHSGRVIPVQTKDGPKGYLYDISANGTGNAKDSRSLAKDFVFYPYNTVMAMKAASPISPLYPMSPMNAIESASAASRFASTAAKELYRTSATVQGILYTDDLNDATITSLQRQFTSTWGPGLNRKRLAVLRKDKEELVQWKNADAHGGLVGDLSTLSYEVANILGVPEAIINPASKTQDTIQSADATFWMYRLLPLANLFADEITRVMCIGRYKSVVVKVATRQIPQLALMMLNHTKTVIASMDAGLRVPLESRADAGYGGYPQYLDEEAANWSKKPIPLTTGSKAGDRFGSAGTEGGQSRPGGSNSMDTSLKKAMDVRDLPDHDMEYALPHEPLWNLSRAIADTPESKQDKLVAEFQTKLMSRLQNVN